MAPAGMERNMAADNTATDIQRVWDLMKAGTL
jgi:hypothetical protein